VTTGALAERAARRTQLFGISLVSTVLVSALNLPWKLTAFGFGLLTGYAGVRLLADLGELRRAGLPARGRAGVIVGIGLTGLMLLLLLGEAVLYPLAAAQERCLGTALTHQDRKQCHQDFDRQQQELLRRFRRASP
jgi:hypothetical protein